MKLRNVLAVLSVAALAACGGGKPKGVVQFLGLTPNTELQKKQDKREVRAFCPNCRGALEMGASECDDKRFCKQRNINWEGTYPCAYCDGQKSCPACRLLEQEGGKCGSCKGAGYLTYQGKTPDCPNCKNGKCPICEGSNQCDWCKGEGSVSFTDLQARAKKPGEGQSENVSDPK